jgi:DNA-binding MarR family transcriptional regulator
MPSALAAEVYETLSFRLARVSSVWRTELERRISVLGLHSGQIFLLFELWSSDGRSQAELAAALRLSTPTVSRMMKALIASGVIECHDSIADGRVKHVFLTDLGRSLEKRVFAEWRTIEEDFFKALTPAESIMTGLLLDKLAVPVGFHELAADQGEQE